jgi:Asp-tRNA(Asn)/Glu-tRNA(Gln) amidotransferase C subunit
MPHPADFLTAVRLANLQLEPDEVDRLAAGIAGIIAHVEALRATRPGRGATVHRCR